MKKFNFYPDRYLDIAISEKLCIYISKWFFNSDLYLIHYYIFYNNNNNNVLLYTLIVAIVNTQEKITYYCDATLQDTYQINSHII